jgi:hypothetical protein
MKHRISVTRAGITALLAALQGQVAVAQPANPEPPVPLPVPPAPVAVPAPAAPADPPVVAPAAPGTAAPAAPPPAAASDELPPSLSQSGVSTAPAARQADAAADAAAQQEAKTAAATATPLLGARGGTLGFPGSGAPGVIAALKLQGGKNENTKLEVLAQVGQLRLNDSIALDIITEQVSTDVPTVTYTPGVGRTPLLGLSQTSWTSAGFRVRITTSPGQASPEVQRKRSECMSVAKMLHDENRVALERARALPRQRTEEDEVAAAKRHAAAAKAAALAAKQRAEVAKAALDRANAALAAVQDDPKAKAHVDQAVAEKTKTDADAASTAKAALDAENLSHLVDRWKECNTEDIEVDTTKDLTEKGRLAKFTDYQEVANAGYSVSAGGRFLYRTEDISGNAPGAAAEITLEGTFTWGSVFLSGSMLWLTDSLEEKEDVVSVTEELVELRSTAGLFFRFNTPVGSTQIAPRVGLYATYARNFWNNRFAPRDLDSDVSGYQLEAGVFASGQFTGGFNGLIQFSLRAPYGPDSKPELLVTVVPSLGTDIGGGS